MLSIPLSWSCLPWKNPTPIFPSVYTCRKLLESRQEDASSLSPAGVSRPGTSLETR